MGSFFNLPVARIPRSEAQVYEMRPMLGVWTWAPQVEQGQFATIIAVNVGGCVVPVLLALWQLRYVASAGGWPVAALLIASAVNIAACYRTARPIRGVGVGMPGFVSPLVAVGMTWLLLGVFGDGDYGALRAPTAFFTGVVGPLVGADLLHLREVTRMPTGMLSIGGAGTFDGIVLSSVVAALLA